MDKAEYRIKLDELTNLVEEQDYIGALQIADSVDWRRVKSVRTLGMVADIYEVNKDYKRCREILLLARSRSMISKRTLYRLVEISLKLGDAKDAAQYYSEFVEAAPHDNSRYILQYKIYKAQRAPLEDQIAVLEAYKEREYTERYAYELAKLYSQAGMREKCVEACDDLVLWFAEGKYVKRALELKVQYQPLSASQQEKVSDALQQVAKETAMADMEARMDEIPTVLPESFEKPAELKEQLTKSIQEVFAGIKKPEEPVAQEEPEAVPEEEAPTTDLDLNALMQETAEALAEEIVPMSIEEVLREETPEERRFRILTEERPQKLTDEQKKIFTYFAKVPGMDQQVLDALSGVYCHADEKTSRHGNVAIMGGYGTGKTRLSEGIVRAICKDLGLTAAKYARIDAAELNKKDPAAVADKMSGGFLLIEHAGLLYPEVLQKLNQALEFRTDSMVVIIEDEKASMRTLLRTYPEFAKKFDTVISIPVFTNDELVTFARTYARESGYKMDELGVLALYTLIGNNQTDEQPVTITNVKEMVDHAIVNAEKGTRKLSRRVSKRHVDDQNRIILYEKDFEM